MLKIPKLKELSFLVYGLGLSGTSVVKFFKKKGIKNFEVWDDNQKKTFKNYRSRNLRKTISEVDFIILSPGITLIKNKILRNFKNKIITDIDLFFLEKNNSKSVVVTGTNGKSTTCKLLEHLLKKNNLKCSLGGNIGKPVLDIDNSKNKYTIIEASSFQLSHSKFICPDYALFLNISNDHLDWHGNMHNYFNSKLKIFKHQRKNHFAIINNSIIKNFKNKKFLSKAIKNNIKEYKTRVKHKIKNDYLSSTINDENMSFVYSFSKLIKIKEKNFTTSMKSFKGLPHRFEIFLKKRDTVFINDSKATTFRAAHSALQDLKNIYWILGGQPKEKDKFYLGRNRRNIVRCYLIGDSINFFKKQIKGKVDFLVTFNLKKTILQILRDIKFKKEKEKFILFSPAAASFDQFKNFEERGDEFKRLCKKYVRKII